MMLSTTLQSKISKTKKRLSDTVWYLPCLLIALVGLISVMSFSMRLSTISWNFGLISAQIPVMFNSLQDTGMQEEGPTLSNSLTRNSPAIVMDYDAFYIGDLAAFTVDFGDIRNKYRVPHRDGAPAMGELIKTLEKWHQKRRRQFKLNNQGFVILVPADNWPAAIVMQVVHYLKASPLYDEVILAGGLH